MKANELRTGNYVKYVFDDETIQIEDHSFRHAKAYNPIPLTEKWLLEFGFEKQKYQNCFGGFDFVLKASCCWFSYTSSDFSLCIANKRSNLDSCDFITPTHSKIINVHELQNLYFALTGEELKRTL